MIAATTLSRSAEAEPARRRCQTKSSRSPNSGKLAPVGQRDNAVQFEDIAAVEVAVLVEVVVDRGMGGEIVFSILASQGPDTDCRSLLWVPINRVS